jgi:hypothetical protein
MKRQIFSFQKDEHQYKIVNEYAGRFGGTGGGVTVSIGFPDPAGTDGVKMEGRLILSPDEAETFKMIFNALEVKKEGSLAFKEENPPEPSSFQRFDFDGTLEKTRKEVYSGLISEHSVENFDDPVLFLSDLRQPLAKALEWIDSRRIKARYWISKEEKSIEEAEESAAKALLGYGKAELSSYYYETSSFWSTTQEIDVGGHDLLRELQSFAGKWVILEVEEMPKETPAKPAKKVCLND